MKIRTPNQKLLFPWQRAGWTVVRILDDVNMTAYRAYLLRLWLTETEAAGVTAWQASLEDSRTGERLGFANLDQLFAYLVALTEGITGKVQDNPPATNQPAL